MDRPTPKEMVQQFSFFCNSFSIDEKVFAEAMLDEHRTLQQSMFKVMVACMRKWAESYHTGRYDDRNADTCRISKRIVEEIMKDERIRFI